MLKRCLTGVISVVFAVTALCLPMSAKEAEGATGSNDGWNLVWSDEFNGTELDRSNWNVEVNGYGGWNNELQYYCDSPQNIAVNDGTLKITALKKDYMGKEYTSARINSSGKAQFRFGKIEAKMKLPSFQGAWPAFWMLGANGLMWPACGEIDILETINNESIAYGTAHWQAGDSYSSSGSSTLAAGAAIDITQWHTYGIEWNEKTIIWYVDDIKYFALDISSDPNMASLALEQYLIFNLAIGGDWPGFVIDDGAIPATMEVDYVRVYEKDNGGGEVPTITVKDDSVENYEGTWSGTAGAWAGASGTITSSDEPKKGFVADLTAVGREMWGVQTSLSNLSYVAGNSYTFHCMMISDTDKNVFVKVEGDNNAELSADYIHLKANEPYEYEKNVWIPTTYTGAISLFYAYGGGINGETIDSNTVMNLKVRDVAFYTESVIENPELPTSEETTTVQGQEEITTLENTTEEALKTQISMNGFQISTTVEGFRTIYTVHSGEKKVKCSGLIYGLGDVEASDMVIDSKNSRIYHYPSTEVGKMPITLGDNKTDDSYAMTMKFIKNPEFYSAKIHVRAYAELIDGTYIYSDCKTTSVYDICDYLYQKKKMNTYLAHMYLYNNILRVVNTSYETNDYDWGSAIVSKN